MKDIKKLEKELNEEYADLGEISIDSASKKTVDPSSIVYVDPIMERVEPLESDEPIVVGKSFWAWESMQLIDGYHRLKKAITNGDDEIEIIYLEDYILDRKDDNLLSFVKGLVGREICFHDNYTFELDGELYKIKKNEGCGGCGNGWSDLEVVPKFIGETIGVQSVHSEDEGHTNPDKYDLFINDKLFAEVDTGWGNGYYGGDFDIIR